MPNKRKKTKDSEQKNFRVYLTEAGKKLAEKLNEEIERGDTNTAFFIALNIALFKDFQDVIVDFVGLGEIPLIGELIGLFCFAALTYFMWGKGWFLKTRLRIYWWVFGLFVDNLPLFNVLPIDTLLVLYAWHLVRKRSQAAKKQLGELNQLTEKEVAELNKNIGLLDNEPTYTSSGKLTKKSKSRVKEAKKIIAHRSPEMQALAKRELLESGGKSFKKPSEMTDIAPKPRLPMQPKVQEVPRQILPKTEPGEIEEETDESEKIIPQKRPARIIPIERAPEESGGEKTARVDDSLGWGGDENNLLQMVKGKAPKADPDQLDLVARKTIMHDIKMIPGTKKPGTQKQIPHDPYREEVG